VEEYTPTHLVSTGSLLPELTHSIPLHGLLLPCNEQRGIAIGSPLLTIANALESLDTERIFPLGNVIVPLRRILMCIIHVVDGQQRGIGKEGINTIVQRFHYRWAVGYTVGLVPALDITSFT